MDGINSYAIVAYVAGPIARFAERLRQDHYPGCAYRAHITILPPRPLRCADSEAIEFARQQVSKFEPFEVKIGPVDTFSDTEVIYLSVTAGDVELGAMHDVLNTGLLEQEEEHPYAPHLTLAQEFPPDSGDQVLEICHRRWQEFGAAVPFRIEAVTFVQQRADGNWADLAELGLGRVSALG